MPLNASLKTTFTYLTSIAKEELLITSSTINTFLIEHYFFSKHVEDAEGIKHYPQNGRNTEVKLKVLQYYTFITTAFSHNK